MDHDDNRISLFRKYIDGELSPRELRELKEYLSISSENMEVFINFLSLYKTGIQLAAKKHLKLENAWMNMQKKIDARYKRKQLSKWVAAASVAIILGLSSFLYWNLSESVNPKSESLVELYPNMGVRKASLTLSDGRIISLHGNSKVPIKEFNGCIVGYNNVNCLVYDNLSMNYKVPLYNKIEVPEGSEYAVTLSDGTKIWLNSRSTLEYPIVFSSIRNVRFHGEAYFEVAHNESRPFVVQSSKTKIRVLGTKFNVTAYDPNKITVTLIEGKVAVSFPSGKEILSPGDQVQVSETNTNFKKKVNVNIYTSWVTGTFEFNNTSMEDIVTQLSLWYDVKMEFASPELKNVTFTGAILKNKSLGYALKLIQKVSNLSFQKEGDTIIVNEQNK